MITPLESKIGLKEGHLHLERLANNGALRASLEGCLLDGELLRTFVRVHLNEDKVGLSHLERLVTQQSGDGPSPCSSSHIVLLALYLELLRQIAERECNGAPVPNIVYADQRIQQFLRTQKDTLFDWTSRELGRGECASSFIAEPVCNMLVEMHSNGIDSPFREIDIIQSVIIDPLRSERTSIALRRAIERLALLHLRKHTGDTLLPLLVDTLVDADFFLVQESVARILQQPDVIVSLSQFDRQRIVKTAKRTYRIGHSFAEFTAKILLPARTEPEQFLRNCSEGFVCLSSHSVILAKLIALDESPPKELLQLLAEQTHWDLNTIGPILPKFLCEYPNDFLVERLIRSICSANCTTQSVRAFVAVLLEMDPQMDKEVPSAVDQIISSDLLKRPSALSFFATLCSTSSGVDDLKAFFAKQPQQALRIAQIVGPLCNEEEKKNENSYEAWNWEEMHSALELLVTCGAPAVSPLDPGKLFSRLLRISVSDDNIDEFLRQPAIKLLFKHFAEKSIEYWPKLYAQNAHNDELKTDLLANIVAEMNNGLTPGKAESATALLNRMLEWLPDEECLPSLNSALELWQMVTEYQRNMMNTEDGPNWQSVQKHLKERIAAMAENKQRKRQERDLQELMEDLVPALAKNCMVGEEGHSTREMCKDCY